MGLEDRRVVGLVDLVRREVRSVNSTRETRLERRADATERIELDAPEKGVAFDFVRTATAETIFGVDDQTIQRSVRLRRYSLVSATKRFLTS